MLNLLVIECPVPRSECARSHHRDAVTVGLREWATAYPGLSVWLRGSHLHGPTGRGETFEAKGQIQWWF